MIGEEPGLQGGLGAIGALHPRRIGVIVPGAFPGVPSYRVPEGLAMPAVGARVAVPFGPKLVTAVVSDLAPPPAPEGVRERDLVAVLDEEPFLTPGLVAVLLRASRYYFAPPGELLRAAVPARLLTGAEAVYVPTDLAVGARRNERETQILAFLLETGRANLSELAKALGSRGLLASLKALAADGLVRIPSESARSSRAPQVRTLRASSGFDPARLRGPKQKALHAHLVALERSAGMAELKGEGFTPGLAAALVKAGAASFGAEERRADLSRHVGAARPNERFRFTDAQGAAIDGVSVALSEGVEASFLVYGVTGSGKTEVYLALLEKARAMGKSGILLVPEIALAPALVRRLLGRFGDRVSLLHSALSQGDRASEWERARRGEVDVVVGPRSAIFAPLPNLGLVVFDEAHEGAYKQAERPLYDARDVGRARARDENLVLVFGTATPSMELERPAREARLPRFTLPSRPEGRNRAAVEVVDLRGEVARKGDHGRILIAKRTQQILEASLARDEQIILLLNRRGFSPSLLCRACGEDFRCRSCSVARTYHRSGERLICHYCGDLIRRPVACPKCASEVLHPVGFGTERLAERFEEAFPGVSYAVLDRDAAARRGGAAGVLHDFETGRARALLGTQMVAKGHDYPNATALAVLDADALLSFPDFRAAERTFQLVTQAAGRVGRGTKPGLVAVQTSRPEHDAIRAAVAQDHEAFADAELRFRRAFLYPPFARLLLALFTHEDAGQALREASAGAAAVRSSRVAAELRLLGPAPAPIERIKGLYRFQLLLKSQSREALAEAGALLAALPSPPRLDVDPQNLL